MDTGRIGLRFENRQAFGEFCAALAEHKVRFAIAPPLTVVLTMDDYKALPPPLSKQQWIAADPITRGDKRTTLPSRTDAESKMWRYSKAN